jgi:hypothetical protein
VKVSFQSVAGVLVLLLYINPPSPCTPTHHRNPPQFLVHDWKRYLRTSVGYVQTGKLSDKPGVAMYVLLGTLSTGFKVYRCLRSSSQLEAYWLYLRELTRASGRGCCPAWLDALCEDADFRWNMRAGRKLEIPGYIASDHFELDLHDQMKDFHEMVGSTAYDQHHRTREFPILLEQGCTYMMKTMRALWKENGAPIKKLNAINLARETSLQWLARNLGVADGNVRMRPTVEDIKFLTPLVKGNLGNPSAIVTAAKKRGLLLTGPSAKALMQRLTKEQDVYDHLGNLGYQQLAADVIGGGVKGPGPMDVIPTIEAADVDESSSLIPAPITIPKPTGSREVQLLAAQGAMTSTRRSAKSRTTVEAKAKRNAKQKANRLKAKQAKQDKEKKRKVNAKKMKVYRSKKQ